MSLQIWLPLNGNLKNQGLKEVKIINNGTTFDANGKIGQCCNIASGQYLGFDATNKNNHKYPYISIACWIYPTQSDSTERHVICCYESGGCGINLKNTKFGGQVYVGGYKSCYTPNTISLNTWYHVCMTYNGTKLCLYLNGEQVATVAASGPITYHNTCPWQIAGNPGATSFGSNNFIGKINDFRMYDHALSAKEVKEIAKGLVIHYKLDSGINYSTNLLTTTKATSTTKYNAYQVNMSPNFTAEEPYTLQLGGIDISHTGKTADTLGVSVYWGGGYIPLCNWAGTNYIVNGKADYLKATFIPHNTHANSANSWINIYNSPPSVTGTMSLTIKDWRLTPGNSVPFIPDVSGYNNNGEIMGNISFTTDTPKYNNSISFSNTAGKIRPQNFNSAGLTNSYTFAWWQYNTSTGNMAWGFSDGNRTNLYQTTTMSWNTGDGNTNQFKTSSNSTLSAATYQNKWTHFCITGDGTTTKLYINGSYIASATTYKPITGNNLWISGWDASTSYTFNGSKLSDFRVYATALSDKDIAELYNTSSSIDNKGNVYARELVEE